MLGTSSNNVVLYSTLNVSGFTTLTGAVQVNTSLNVRQNISFLGSLNGITTSVFFLFRWSHRKYTKSDKFY
jgi:hypothetical protein